MRLMIVALVAALVAMGAGAATENCVIRDSAVCAANPNCHWDYERRGCETDVSLGCNWNAETNKCESAN